MSIQTKCSIPTHARQRFTRFAMLCFFGLGSLACHQPTPDLVAVVPKPTHENSSWSYARVVALETHEDALLGNIGKVVVDPDTNDILVGDFRSAKRVFRFSEQGTFLRAYGAVGEGPGEYQNLTNFTLGDDGRLFLLAERTLLRFKADGTFEKQVNNSQLVSEIMYYKGRLYIRGLPFYKDRAKEAIHIYDQDLNEVKRMHPRDPRMQKMTFFPSCSVAAYRDTLFVGHPFDFQLSAYPLQGETGQAKAFSLPQDNHRLHEILAKRRLNDEDQNQAFGHIQRADCLFAFEDGLFFIEYQPRSKGMRFFTFQPEQQHFAHHPDWNFIGYEDEVTQLPIGFVAGAHAGGLIGVCDETGLINRFKHQHPEIADRTFTMQDNPVLVFIDLHLTGPKPGLNAEVSVEAVHHER